MTAIMTKFHWFWAWDDEKEEGWLREMAQQGWHFKSVSAPGLYTFEQGDPGDYTYRLDYFIDRKDKSHYLQLFADSGWEYMGEMGGWQYFRQLITDNEPREIFTDNESKAKKYQRIMIFLVILLPILLNFLIVLGKNESTLSNIFGMIMAVFMLLYTYAMVRLLMRISQLRKKW